MKLYRVRLAPDSEGRFERTMGEAQKFAKAKTIAPTRPDVRIDYVSFATDAKTIAAILNGDDVEFKIERSFGLTARGALEDWVD